MRRLSPLLALLVLSACSKDKDATPASATGSSAPAAAAASSNPTATAAVAPASASANPGTAPPPAGGDALVGPVQFGPEGPVVIDPPVVVKRGEGGDHATVHGWASDSSELGYCFESAGTGAHDCAFLKPGAKLEKVSDFDPEKGAADDAKAKAIKSRTSAKGYQASAANWPYASELRVTWKAGTSGHGPEGSGILRVGLRIESEADGVYPIYVEAKGVISIHPDAIAISPDGKYLGVVSHGAGGEGNDKFDLRIMAIPTLVSQVYNDTGFAHHKKGEFQRSAELFHKAAAADPTNTLAPYNYACALAQLKHPGTEAALRAAITAGGDKVKAKAAKDSDFAGVKNEAWFSALVK